MKVTVIGTGYVGLTTGVALAFLGHQVVGVDKDQEKIELLEALESPIHERGLEEMMRSSRHRLTFTTNTEAGVADADVILIAVGTPAMANGAADTQYVEAAAREVASGLLAGRSYVLVVKSTVPIGTNLRVAYVVSRVLEERGVEANVTFASNPEFLREGKALFDTLYPDRIVVGSAQSESLETLRRLYQPLLTQSFSPPTYLPRPERYPLPTIVETDATSAEMIKYASNAFLALKISYINEVAGLCEKVGADVTEVSRGMGLDHRIGRHFLNAGLGWGGSCFPKDTNALIALGLEYGYTMPIVAATREVNQRQRELIVEKLQSGLKVVRGRTITILGMAFKPGTDDLREAPALEIINTLLERGAHVRAHDPIALPEAKRLIKHADVDFIHDPYEACDGADAVILATEWPELRALDLGRIKEKMRGDLFVDGRNAINRAEALEAGLVYEGVGR